MNCVGPARDASDNDNRGNGNTEISMPSSRYRRGQHTRSRPRLKSKARSSRFGPRGHSELHRRVPHTPIRQLSPLCDSRTVCLVLSAAYASGLTIDSLCKNSTLSDYGRETLTSCNVLFAAPRILHPADSACADFASLRHKPKITTTIPETPAPATNQIPTNNNAQAENSEVSPRPSSQTGTQ